MIGIQDQYFGTEIEMTGITRQRVAEVVAELFGTEAVYEGAYYGIWSARDREGKKWKFMSDGSIDTQRKSGGRIVSADRESLFSPGFFRRTGQFRRRSKLSSEREKSILSVMRD